MKTNIVVTLRVEGFHNWPNAKEVLPKMGFLADRHRHMFHIKAKAEVSHDDRDIEIIDFKREVEAYIERVYGKPAEFGSRSCESIATDLLETFDLVYCEVLEDGENGAEVIK